MPLLTQHITYKALNEKEAAELAVELNIFQPNAELSCTEIGDGNLNLVFRITNQIDNKSIIIKQALPYAKVVGESWPLTLKRATIEAEALKIFKNLSPDFVPEVYYTDETLAITVMEDLSHLTIARNGLISGEEYPLIGKHLGEYLANTIFYTSDYGLDQGKKKGLVRDFHNPELCKITEDLIFTDPFYDVENNNFECELKDTVDNLWKNEELKLEAALLKKSFLTETESLLHGDLHTGSVFASKTETKVIDPEFAFYGPVGFDIGQVIANFTFQAISNPNKKAYIAEQIESFWNEFQVNYTNHWNNHNKEPHSHVKGYLTFLLKKYFQDAIGFAGCELIRRTIGLSHVADLDKIRDDKSRIHAKKATLEIGEKFILQRKQMHDLQELISYL